MRNQHDRKKGKTQKVKKGRKLKINKKVEKLKCQIKKSKGPAAKRARAKRQKMQYW